MIYNNVITNDATDYPYRFKTEDEFIADYGIDWRSIISWNPDGEMDYLFGQDLLSIDKEKTDDLLIHGIVNSRGFVMMLSSNNGWYVQKEMLIKNIIPNFNEFYRKTKKLVYENIMKYKKGNN